MSIKTIISRILKTQHEVESPKPVTVKDLIQDKIECNNRSIQEYLNMYLNRFYKSWQDSIHSIRVTDFNKLKDSDCTFIVEDDYTFRPEESWTLFLDTVLTRHPDITWVQKDSDVKALGKTRVECIFHYINCLNDTISGAQD